MSKVEDANTYKSMENVLNAINKQYVSLVDTDVKRNMPILQKIIDEIIQKMKNNTSFKMMFQNISYNGSYYDNLKIGKPEEFDLDLVMVFPKICNVQMIESDCAGYVYLQLLELEKLMKQQEGFQYKVLETLIDSDKFLLINKFRAWMEKILIRVLNEYEKEGSSVIISPVSNGQQCKCLVRVVKSGPALTLKISGKLNDEDILMDVDLVPAFIFSNDKWPKGEGYRKNPIPNQKPSFFVVPKAPLGASSERYWRLSFQEQEKHLINLGYQRLKPTIRLLKRLRDQQNHVIIASYYIKTIFLWESQDRPKEYWDGSLSSCFMKGLVLYEKYLRDGTIPFYWNSKNNLLSNIKKVTLTDFANKLKNVIDDINRAISDPFTVAKYLMPTEEIQLLRENVQVGKKVLNQQLTDDGLSARITSTNVASPPKLGVSQSRSDSDYKNCDLDYDIVNLSLGDSPQVLAAICDNASFPDHAGDVVDSSCKLNIRKEEEKESGADTPDDIFKKLCSSPVGKNNAGIENLCQDMKASNLNGTDSSKYLKNDANCEFADKERLYVTQTLAKLESNQHAIMNMLNLIMDKLENLEKRDDNRHLKRVLKHLKWWLWRRKRYSNIDEVVSFMQERLLRSNQLRGYRWMHLKCLQYRHVVCRETVRLLLRDLDPQGNTFRKNNM